MISEVADAGSTGVTAPRAAGGRLGALCEIGLDIAALLFLPLLTLVSHAAAPLVAFAGLMALGRALPFDRAALRRLRVPAALCLGMLAWGTVSALWAVEPARSLLIALRLTGLFAAAFALALAAGRLAAPRRLAGCFLAGLALAVIAAEVQFATGGLLTRPFFERPFVGPRLNQLADALAILALPSAAMLWARRRPTLAAVVALAAAAAVYHFVGDAAKGGFAVAVAALLLFRLGGGNLMRAAAILSVLAVLAAPLTLPRLAHLSAVSQDAAQFKFSLWHRLQIWSFVGDRIAERPLFGWGLDASRAIPGGTDPIGPGVLVPKLPLHPHDAALQIWLELGVPGALLFAGFAAWLWLTLARSEWPPLYRAAAGAGLAAACFAALGTYGVWQEWWIATLSLALFVILVLARLAGSGTEPRPALSPSPGPSPARSRTSP